MAENNNITQQPTHTYDEVLKAIERLSEDDKNFILQQMTVQQITQVVDSKESLDEYCKALDACARSYLWLHRGLELVYDKLNAPTDEVEDIVSDYKKLNIEQRKDVAVRLLNNMDFQKNCYNVLLNSFSKFAVENSTKKPFDNLLNLYKKLLDLGFWCVQVTRRSSEK